MDLYEHRNKQITISRPKLRLDASGLADQNGELRVFCLQILVIVLDESSVQTKTKRRQSIRIHDQTNVLDKIELRMDWQKPSGRAGSRIRSE